MAFDEDVAIRVRRCFADDETLDAWVRLGMAFVASLPPKRAGARRPRAKRPPAFGTCRRDP